MHSDLIARLEALSGPDTMSFTAAYNACYPNGGTPWASDARHRERFMFLIHWEAYLEAAFMLVPKGGCYSTWCSFALPYPYHAAVSVEPFMTEAERNASTVCHEAQEIALCIAALRARSADNG